MLAELAAEFWQAEPLTALADAAMAKHRKVGTDQLSGMSADQIKQDSQRMAEEIDQMKAYDARIRRRLIEAGLPHNADDPDVKAVSGGFTPSPRWWTCMLQDMGVRDELAGLAHDTHAANQVMEAAAAMSDASDDLAQSHLEANSKELIPRHHLLAYYNLVNRWLKSKEQQMLYDRQAADRLQDQVRYCAWGQLHALHGAAFPVPVHSSAPLST